jgi:Zn finger protein HypA/HybF involved in hydrogenase expression
MIFEEREVFKEVERQLEMIPRIKCLQCHCYMPEGTLSLYCKKCSIKKIG